MKKFLAGMFFVLGLTHINTFVHLHQMDHGKNTKVTFAIQHYMDGDYLAEVLTKRCTKDLRFETPRREYFQCGRLRTFMSDLIFGEYDKETR